MTQKECFRLIREMGMTANKTTFGEIRVNFPRPVGTEDSAYYTDDRKDAVDTARAMRARHDALREEERKRQQAEPMSDAEKAFLGVHTDPQGDL